jgi:hypothetical protein
MSSSSPMVVAEGLRALRQDQDKARTRQSEPKTVTETKWDIESSTRLLLVCFPGKNLIIQDKTRQRQDQGKTTTSSRLSLVVPSYNLYLAVLLCTLAEDQARQGQGQGHDKTRQDKTRQDKTKRERGRERQRERKTKGMQITSETTRQTIKRLSQDNRKTKPERRRQKTIKRQS